MNPLPRLVWATALASILASILYEFTGSTGVAYLGSYHLEVTELILALGVSAFLFSFPLTPRLAFSFIGLFAIVLAGLFGASIARGVASSPGVAVNAARITSVIACWLVIGVRLRARPYDLAPFMRIVTWAALVIALLVIVRSGLGSEFAYFGTYKTVFDIFDGGRPASSTGALLIGSGIVLFCAGFRLFRTAGLNAGLLVLLVIALFITKQATATVASLVGIAVALLFHPKVIRSVGLPVIPLALGIGPLGVIFLDKILSWLPQSLTGDTSRRVGNLEWRKEIWGQYLDGYRSETLLKQAIGIPAGTHEVIVLHPGNDSIFWEGSLHSAYYAMLQNAGAIGLLAYALFTLGVLSACALRSFTSGRTGETNPAIGAAFICLLLTFSYSYELRAENALMLVIGMVLAQSRTFPALAQSTPPATLPKQFPQTPTEVRI
jgi:hypothetical protein